MPDRTPPASQAIATLQEPLRRYARSRLRNPAMADDAVSDTLLAVLESRHDFDTHRQLVAWAFGVLKHKLVDQLRAHHRECPLGDLADVCAGAAAAWTGAWQQVRHEGRDPEQAFGQQQFIALVDRCCRALPEAQRQAFVMREVMDMDTPSICAALAVSQGNLWVLIHRARMRLRSDLAGYGPAAGRRNASAVA